MSVKMQKKHGVCRKDSVQNPATCRCKNSKHLANIIDDSVFTCDEIIQETKTVPKNFNEEKKPVKQKLYFY